MKVSALLLVAFVVAFSTVDAHGDRTGRRLRGESVLQADVARVGRELQEHTQEGNAPVLARAIVDDVDAEAEEKTQEVKTAQAEVEALEEKKAQEEVEALEEKKAQEEMEALEEKNAQEEMEALEEKKAQEETKALEEKKAEETKQADLAKMANNPKQTDLAKMANNPKQTELPVATTQKPMSLPTVLADPNAKGRLDGNRPRPDLRALRVVPHEAKAPPAPRALFGSA